MDIYAHQNNPTNGMFQMNQSDYDLSIEIIEEYYCDRMSYLVDEERFADADAIFNEFVLDSENPDEWTFIEDVTNVL